mmetsp:Transcript_13865/g.28633  ORF Transcript_13865/g.28633 Transcript_13865/m.28633 type:complete len:85 (+) Transcript_13865:936-1190(+)
MSQRYRILDESEKDEQDDESVCYYSRSKLSTLHTPGILQFDFTPPMRYVLELSKEQEVVGGSSDSSTNIAGAITKSYDMIMGFR